MKNRSMCKEEVKPDKSLSLWLNHEVLFCCIDFESRGIDGTGCGDAAGTRTGNGRGKASGFGNVNFTYEYLII